MVENKVIENKTNSKIQDISDSEINLMQEKVTALKQLITTSANAETLHQSLKDLEQKIGSAAKSVTSIPEALKASLPFLNEFIEFFENHPNQSQISLLADIISCISMISSEENRLLCLEYKLKSVDNDISRWGHEYVRHLSREIIQQKNDNKESNNAPRIEQLVEAIVDFDMNNAAENEAVDLLIEMENLGMILRKADKSSSERISNYLLTCRLYFPAELPQSVEIATTAAELSLLHGKPVDAMIIALISNDQSMVQKAFDRVKDSSEKLQIALIIGLQRTISMEKMNALLKSVPENEQIRISAALSNETQGERFLWLAEQLNTLEPKKLEDIYKSHLIDRSTFNKYEKKSRKEEKRLDSARENLAATFVNAFVHAGYGRDSLSTDTENSDWVFRNKESGMMSAVASVGLVNLWNLENGFQAVDQFSESSVQEVSAGALLGFGLIGSGIPSEMNPGPVLLRDHMETDNEMLKLHALMGLGISQVGTQDEETAKMLDSLVSNQSSPQICAFACLTYGLVFLGSCKDEAVSGVFEALQFASKPEYNQSYYMLMSIGLALIYIGSEEKCEGILEALVALGPEKQKLPEVLVKAFAYAGSGNVLRFHEAIEGVKNSEPEENENKDNKEKEDDKTLKECNKALDETISCLNVLALALIPLGEKLGSQMAFRIFDDLLRYEGVANRRGVPLSLALLYASKPDYTVVQLLGKLSHDPDEALSQNAILALGIVAAGTNNSRVAKLLRNLAVYYQKDPDHILITRISQGLVHCGKGLLTLSPLHFDGMLVNKSALAGLLIVLVSCLDMKNGILGTRHYILFFLAMTMRARMLMTVDEDLNPLIVSVRVGQAVDNAKLGAQAQNITGFQTQQTPVLLSAGEKAELATKKYIALSNFLEGVVILKRNPEFVEDEHMDDD